MTPHKIGVIDRKEQPKFNWGSSKSDYLYPGNEKGGEISVTTLVAEDFVQTVRWLQRYLAVIFCLWFFFLILVTITPLKNITVYSMIKLCSRRGYRLSKTLLHFLTLYTQDCPDKASSQNNYSPWQVGFRDDHVPNAPQVVVCSPPIMSVPSEQLKVHCEL